MEEDCQGTAPWVLGQAQGKLAAPRPLLEQGKNPSCRAGFQSPPYSDQRVAPGSLRGSKSSSVPGLEEKEKLRIQPVGQGMLRTLRLARGPGFCHLPAVTSSNPGGQQTEGAVPTPLSPRDDTRVPPFYALSSNKLIISNANIIKTA